MKRLRQEESTPPRLADEGCDPPWFCLPPPTSHSSAWSSELPSMVSEAAEDDNNPSSVPSHAAGSSGLVVVSEGMVGDDCPFSSTLDVVFPPKRRPFLPDRNQSRGVDLAAFSRCKKGKRKRNSFPT